MKKITIALLGAVVFGFVGCTNSDTTTNTPELPDNGNVGVSVIPEPSEGYGLEYDVTSYFFPYDTLINGYTYKDYAVTTKDADGYFNEQKRVIKHYVEGNKNGFNESVITVYQNNSVIKRSVVGKNGIIDTTYDENRNEIREHYSKLMQVNDDLIRNESGACVLKQKFENFYIGNVVPAQADPHQNPVQYGSVLHFYCGTSNKTKIDRYYADAYGEIISIYQYNAGLVEYVVLDKNTDQAQ